MRCLLPGIVGALAVSIALPPQLVSVARAEPPVAYVEAPKRTDALADAITVELGTAVLTTKGEDRRWLGMLVELYENRDGRAFWARVDGFSENARQVAAELRRADDWGLDASAYAVADLNDAGGNRTLLAAGEVSLSLAVLKYAAHARGHRVDPSQLSLWLDQQPKPVWAGLVGDIASAEDAGAALRKLHPQHDGFERLRQAWLRTTAAVEETPKPRPTVRLASTGRILRPGIRHPDVAELRERLQVAADGDPQRYDEELEAAVRNFQNAAGLSANGVVNGRVRQALNRELDQPGNSRERERKAILVNMERWRWLPDRLGAVHIWNNLPEFETRVVRDGDVVHEERIIIGKPETQTPIFSDKMRYVVFKPGWGVPSSIKVKELLPKLQRGDTNVLSRRGMRILINGREKDPDDIDWDRVDIRRVPIVQEPGDDNPLGEVKFMFPNKHDVYMHDTPSRHLFKQSRRTFSHGCIRVRNPRKLAELVFGMDRGWDAREVSKLLRDGPEGNKVDLGRSIDVHNVYFTAVADAGGKLTTFRDIYQHDDRIARALAGVPADVIARDDPARAHQASVEEALTSEQTSSRSSRRWRNENREPVSALDWRGPGDRARSRSSSRRSRSYRSYSWGYN